MQVLIIGAGEVGFHTALRLSHEGHRVVVVDSLPERVRQISEQMDVQTLVGQGSSPAVLRTAGVHKADLVLVVTNSDEVNLAACRFARLLAPAATLIARIRSTDYLDFFEEVGAASLDVDTVINPEREVATQIMQFLAVPAASSVADFAGGMVKMLGLKIPPTCPNVGHPLSELRIAGGPRYLVVAIERAGKVIIPRGDDVILSDDLAYVVTRGENIDLVVEHFGLQSQPVRNLVVVGGGSIGRLVAQWARERGIKIRIIEKNEARCEALVDQLEDVTVLNGDGTDLSLLEEENVGAADVFAAVTDDEEDNVLIALLGRKMGARRTIARVAHLGYVPLVSSLGLDLVVSPRFAAVGAILRHLRAGKVLAVAPLKDEDTEVIEVEAQETSELVGKPLSQVKLPQGSLVAAVIRGEEVEIATGDTVVHPGNRLVIFVTRKVLKKVEKLLTVRLEYF
ncbi:Trk system potassium transporter TrkA [Desulfoferula mesophila]|uniref:Trk system potassium uptake protein TrkA n=1 Tax=Desulfoferula mesophila TaxID=3058419 RepID=A0AAU9F259_9BACT|nr:Trk system potassium transport protein TrkA [Desulfoferula mesophilus]